MNHNSAVPRASCSYADTTGGTWSRSLRHSNTSASATQTRLLQLPDCGATTSTQRLFMGFVVSKCIQVISSFTNTSVDDLSPPTRLFGQLSFIFCYLRNYLIFKTVYCLLCSHAIEPTPDSKTAHQTKCTIFRFPVETPQTFRYRTSLCGKRKTSHCLSQLTEAAGVLMMQ